MKKNIFVIVLCALMVFGSIPKTVMAEESSGIEIVTTKEGEKITAEYGNVDTTGTDDKGVYLDASYDNSSIDVKVGDVNSGEDGVYVYAWYGGSVTADVENVTAVDDGVYLEAEHVKESNIEITTKDIKSGNDGVEVNVADGASATITTGTINAEDEGVIIYSYYDGNVDLTVSGDINAENCGIDIYTDTGGKNNIIVEGNVISEGTAISVDEYGDPMKDTSVGIIVNGNISGGDGANLYADSNAIVSLITEGSISGTDSIILDGRDEAEFVVEAKDIEGTDIGVYSNLLDDSSSLIVADTIKGDEVAIALSTDEDQSLKDIQVVAWKIELNKNGNVAENMNALRITSPNEEFEKNNILYVLKLEQPEEGGDIALDMEREIDTFYDDEAWGTANEGTKVYVNVNLKEGYMITGLYNGKGEKQELEKDDKGYYIVVPKGGGVYLTASLKYSIIDKTEGSHELGSNESYFVEIDAPIDEYESTWVDNKNVSKYATVTEGSTIVTLDPSFLNTLAIGWHDLMVRFTSGREIFSRFEITGTAPSNTTNTTDFKIPTTGIEDMSHRYKGYSVALFAIVSSIAIIKSKKAYKVR